MDYPLDPRIPDHPDWKKLTRSAVDVYLFMFRISFQKDGAIQFSYARARDELKISRSTFARAIQQLERLQFIQVVYRGGLGRRASRYALCEGIHYERNYGREECPELDQQERSYRRRLAKLTDPHRFARERNLEKGRGSRR